MDKHQLNEMFDKLVPTPQRKQELLHQLLQEHLGRAQPNTTVKKV